MSGRRFCRWRRFDMNVRRRTERDPQLYPVRAGQGEPQTFGLSNGELRRHANELVEVYGWTPAEVEAVLDVQRRAMP